MSIQHWLFHAETGPWQVHDPVAWALENVHTPLLVRAREGLLSLTADDRERIIRLVTRRCALHCIEHHPGRVVIHFWVKHADLRPWFKKCGLARQDVKVALVERKHEVVTLTSGAEFLYGQPLPPAFPVEDYLEKWHKREVEEADDWRQAPCSWTSFFWAGVDQGRIPWAVVKSIWNKESAHDCANCDRPLLLFALGWSFTLLNRYPVVRRLCPLCRRYFDADNFWEIEEWLVSVVDSRAWPQRHRHRHLIVPWTPPGHS